MVIFRPRASSSDPMDAAASPLPSDETTPPETKMYFVRLLGVFIVGIVASSPVGWVVDQKRLRHPRQTSAGMSPGGARSERDIHIPGRRCGACLNSELHFGLLPGKSMLNSAVGRLAFFSKRQVFRDVP
jgi:hypothetical protein